MQSHNGMRPQDIVVLLKLALLEETIKLPIMAAVLGISTSEISKSMQRSRYANLLSATGRVAVNNLLEFLQYGLAFTFPTKPGAIVRGVPTALSHPFLKEEFPSAETFVWPYNEGKIRGASVEPLYAALPGFIPADNDLYLAVALTDLLRIGRTREKAYAIETLNKLLKP